MRVMTVALASAGIIVAVACGGPHQTSNPPPPTPSSTVAVRAPFGGMNPINIGQHVDSDLLRGNSDPYNDFDGALAQFIAKGLGVTENPVDVVPSTRETKLRQNDVQLVVATYTWTGDRLKDVDFAGVYMVTDQGVLVRRQNAARISQKSDLPVGRAKICTTSGSVQAQDGSVLSHPLRNDEQCREEVENGKSYAMYSDSVILSLLAQGHPDLTVVPVPDLGQRAYYAVGIKKGSPDCTRVADIVHTYLHTDWATDFKTYFPDLSTADSSYQADYQPSDAEFAHYLSCSAH